MMVKPRGTRGDSPNLLEWDHGQYEGKEGKVLGVLDTSRISFRERRHCR
jgi:hypothetical protein